MLSWVRTAGPGGWVERTPEGQEQRGPRIHFRGLWGCFLLWRGPNHFSGFWMEL